MYLPIRMAFSGLLHMWWTGISVLGFLKFLEMEDFAAFASSARPLGPISNCLVFFTWFERVKWHFQKLLLSVTGFWNRHFLRPWTTGLKPRAQIKRMSCYNSYIWEAISCNLRQSAVVHPFNMSSSTSQSSRKGSFFCGFLVCMDLRYHISAAQIVKAALVVWAFTSSWRS